MSGRQSHESTILSSRRRSLLIASLLPLIHAQNKIRGVPKAEWPTYSADPFTCFDKSASFPASRVNDDFCDCADGSDEPGTSACAGIESAPRFYCLNRGFRPTYLRNSVVNDGICDCCDGSDEFASGACKDDCVNAGATAKAEAEANLAAVKAGVATATAWAQEALTSKAGWEAEIATLKATLAEKQAAAGAVEAEKKVAEEKESVLREEFLKKKAEEDAAREAEEAAKRAAEEAAKPAAGEEAAGSSSEGGDGAAEATPDAEAVAAAKAAMEATAAAAEDPAAADAAAGFPSEEMPQHPDADSYGEPNAGGGGGGGEGDRVDHLNEWDSEPDGGYYNPQHEEEEGGGGAPHDADDVYGAMHHGVEDHHTEGTASEPDPSTEEPEDDLDDYERNYGEGEEDYQPPEETSQDDSGFTPDPGMRLSLPCVCVLCCVVHACTGECVCGVGREGTSHVDPSLPSPLCVFRQPKTWGPSNGG